MPGCRGHIRISAPSRLPLETRTLGVGATNGWFAMQIRAFSLPLADTEVDQRVAENWPQLNLLASLPEASVKGLLPSLACWPDVESYGADAVWQAIRRRAEQETDAGDEASELDLRVPEWQAFIRPTAIDLPDFTTKKETPPARARSWLQGVVLVPRLREVPRCTASLGSIPQSGTSLSTDADRIVPILQGPACRGAMRADPR